MSDAREDKGVRRPAERAFFDSDPGFAARILEELPFPVSYLDRDLVYRLCNSAAAATVDLTPDEVVGKSVQEVIGDDAEVIGLLRGVLATGDPYSGIIAFTAPGSDAIAHYRVSYVPVEDESGVAGVLTNVVDVSEIVEIEERDRRLFEEAPDAVVLAKAPGRTYVAANPAACQMFGLSHDDLLTRSIHDLVAPSMYPELAAALEVLPNGEPVRSEWEFRRNDGSTFAGEVVAKLTPSGQVLAIIRDVTERKRSEVELRASEARYRQVFEQSNIGKSITRTDGSISVNQAFCDMLGYTSEELASKTWMEITHPDDIELTWSKIGPLLSGESRSTRFEKRFICSDGSIMWTDLSSSAHIGEDGQPDFFVTALVDISARKAAEEELQRLNAELEERIRLRTEELEQANSELLDLAKAKGDFLRDMSHELRTPLNSVIGFSSILDMGMAGDLSPEQSRQVRIIRSSGEHLLKLINDLLDLSRIESGQTRNTPSSASVNDLVAEVAGMVSPLAATRGLDLKVEVTPDADAFFTDWTKVEQVLLNLLGNAVKFTESGSVGLRASRDGEAVVFEVSDTGPGIPPEDVEHVFDEFYQIHRPGIPKTEGTGLGLPVSKRLVELLGGRIELESELGFGTTFTVRLPPIVVNGLADAPVPR